MRKRYVILSTALFAATALSQKLPSGSEVLQKIVRGTEGVRDYTVDLVIDVNMERIRIPRTKATMYFKSPDKVHFDSPGIAMLPREGMAFNSAAVLERYTAQTLGADTVNGKDVIKIQLAAREPSARLRQVFAWVDPGTWTISRMQTIPYEGRLLTIDFVYAFQDGKYWLPALLSLRYVTLSESGSKKEEQPQPAPDTPLDQMQARAPRNGTLTVQYSDYRINTGLPDEMFEAKEKK